MRAVRVAVAVSGGRDSTALLHCTARLAASYAASYSASDAASHGTTSSVQVHALHVNHGLLAAADAWEQHLRRQVARWSRRGWPLSLQVHRLTTAPQQGDSVEAWARRERYSALTDMARSLQCDLVLLAHHRRDQAETVLLQALRGGGPAGLAAMPHAIERDGIRWLRPWLDHPREAIDAYVKRWRLSHVEDDSNAQPRFARNRLRASVWPALTQAFADAETTLAGVAQRAHEADACLRELAAMDLAQCSKAAGLSLAPWLALSEARRANVLRHWLAQAQTGAVPESLIHRLLVELPNARSAQWPVHDATLLAYRGGLQLDKRADASASVAPRGPVTLDLSQPGRVELPEWRGAFVVECTGGTGLRAASLTSALCRARTGGERFQFAPRSTPRSLKKQFQLRGLPAWQRDAPLVCVGNELVFVPGLGIDARRQCHDDVPRVVLRWESAVSPVCVRAERVSPA